MNLTPHSVALTRNKQMIAEITAWVVAVAVYVFFPQYLSLATAIVIAALFALSCDLVIGFAGILTLGQALYFGLGAYTAGLIAKYGWTEAITGAVTSSLISAGAAAIIGPFVLRLSGLSLMMVTLGLSVIVFEAANKLTGITGGDDGLAEFSMAPLFGYFRWSILGYTKYLYSLAWLVIVYYALRAIVSSAFGVSLQGIRENRVRMELLGTPILRRLVLAYIIAGGVAGLAGALSAQTNVFVGLGVLSIETTLDGIVIVVLGGIGTLSGSLLGAPVYLLIKDVAQQWNPHIWMFAVGALLIFVLRLCPYGLIGMYRAVFEGATRAVKRVFFR